MSGVDDRTRQEGRELGKPFNAADALAAICKFSTGHCEPLSLGRSGRRGLEIADSSPVVTSYRLPIGLQVKQPHILPPTQLFAAFLQSVSPPSAQG